MQTYQELSHLCGDAAKYYLFPLKWPDLLTQQVSCGPAIYLRFVHFISPTYAALPWINWTLDLAALWLFAYVLFEKDFSPAVVYPVLAGFFLSPLIRKEPWPSPMIYGMSERLCFPFMIAGLAGAISERYRVTAIGTFLAVFMRPAEMFLMPLGWVLKPSRKMALAMTLPWLLFSLFRWWAVGDFGMTSQGPFQATIVMAPLLTKTDLAKIPPHLRPVARWMTEIKNLPRSIPYGWIERQSDISTLDYQMRGSDILDNHVSQWAAAFQRPSEADKMLQELWWTTLKLHWRQYLMFYYRRWVMALTHWPDPWLNYGLLGLLFAAYGLRHRFGWKIDPPLSKQYASLLGLGVLFFLASTASLLLVQIPGDRYMDFCYLWLPGLLMGAIWLNLVGFRMEKS